MQCSHVKRSKAKPSLEPRSWAGVGDSVKASPGRETDGRRKEAAWVSGTLRS